MFLYPRSRQQTGQRSKSCFSNNSKTTEANLTKFHRKIDNENVYCAQESDKRYFTQTHNVLTKRN